MLLSILIPAIQNLDAVIGQYDYFLETVQPDMIWLPDHLLGNTLHPDLKSMYPACNNVNLDCWLDPFLTIAIMASKKNLQHRPIDYGIAVTDFIRRSPADIARSVFTLSQCLGRPFNIGVGAGEAENLVPLGFACGPKPVSILENGLQRLKTMMDTGQWLSDNGRLIDFDYQHAPGHIWIGGQGPRMLRLTAEYADGWIPAWKMPSADYRGKVDKIRDICASRGRKVPTIAMYGSLILGESKRHLFARMNSNPLSKLIAISASAEQWQKWGLEHPAGKDSKGMFDVIVRDIPAANLVTIAPQIPAEALSDCYFVGNAEQVLDELYAYKVAGMEQLAISNVSFFAATEPEEQRLAVSEFTKVCNVVKSW